MHFNSFYMLALQGVRALHPLQTHFRYETTGTLCGLVKPSR